jgi:acetoin:2,6-dichlorophenolindophenol oxidoreductase subunit beta
VAELTYRLAVRDALAEELERDKRVFLIGEDLRIGGVFNATPELHERFGPDRVIDTPISELAFTSAAFGAAVTGMRPVVEIMFADFLALILDTLANQAAKYWYVSNEQASVPLTIRTTVGAGGRFGAIHSQTPTGWLMGLPGIKVVAPSTSADAKGLLKAAIRDDNPVVVFEHKLLYGRKGDVLAGDAALEPIGKARVLRVGADVTLVAASAAVESATGAAELLAGAGIEAEVVDLRTLRPMDVDTIVSSTAKTGRLVVIEEGPPSGGYAAEVIASAVERLGHIAARRVTMPDLPIPFSGVLEDAYLPKPHRIEDAARTLLGDTGPRIATAAQQRRSS